MTQNIMTIKGRRFVLVPEEMYSQLTEASLPAFPPADANGNYPADETMLVSIARNLMKRRLALGWSQAELAGRAGVRVETINRIERLRHAPSVRTVDKIDGALAKAESKPTKRRRKSRNN